jgi:hypothetical protein
MACDAGATRCMVALVVPIMAVAAPEQARPLYGVLAYEQRE